MTTVASKRRRRILTGPALLAVVVVASGFAAGVGSLPAGSSAVIAAGFHCAPGSAIPLLKPGQSGSVSSTFHGFKATFRSTVAASTPASGLLAGMPFKGTLTLSNGSQRWTLPRPASTTETQINVLCVVSFKAERHPSVLIEGFTGGAHCCEEPVIYAYDRSLGRYNKVVDMSAPHFKSALRFDDNGGFGLKTVGRQVLLQTADDQFAYVFGCYACTPMPIVLDVLGTRGLVDVTSSHAGLVAASAAQLWKGVVTLEREAKTSAIYGPVSPFGTLAGWTADECTIGRGGFAFAQLRRLPATGLLSDTAYHQATLRGGSFLPGLQAFLLLHGYCRGQSL